MKKSRLFQKGILLGMLFVFSCTHTEPRNKGTHNQEGNYQGGPSPALGNGTPPAPPEGGFSGTKPPDGFGKQPPMAQGNPGGAPGTPGPMPQQMANKNTIIKLITAVLTVTTKDYYLENTTITSSKANTSALYFRNSSKGILRNLNLQKIGGNTTSEEGSNFFGLNAVLLGTEESEVQVENSQIFSNADGANAVFATGIGTKISLKGVKVETTMNSSRGVDATEGGYIEGTGLVISTRGAHSAGIATDRGRGIIQISESVVETRGEGSPGIYSTGTIEVKNSRLVAYGSEGAVVEGKNSIKLEEVELIGHKKAGVMLYQSFSGDAEQGIAQFSMIGGQLEAKEGPLFYVTNTEAQVYLENVQLTGTSGILIKAGSDRWGIPGKNGGNVIMTVKDQEMEGLIIAEKGSSILIRLTGKSQFKGSIQGAAIDLEASSLWEVTGDSEVRYFGSINSFTDLQSRIQNKGYTIKYDALDTHNKYLAGKTYQLAGGGTLTPNK